MAASSGWSLTAQSQAQLAEDIYADETAFWWSWAEPVCPVGDPLAAARKIASVLRTVPGPSHG